jgi:hypothetical protein
LWICVRGGRGVLFSESPPLRRGGNPLSGAWETAVLPCPGVRGGVLVWAGLMRFAGLGGFAETGRSG